MQAMMDQMVRDYEEDVQYFRRKLNEIDRKESPAEWQRVRRQLDMAEESLEEFRRACSG